MIYKSKSVHGSRGFQINGQDHKLEMCCLSQRRAASRRVRECCFESHVEREDSSGATAENSRSEFSCSSGDIPGAVSVAAVASASNSQERHSGTSRNASGGGGRDLERRRASQCACAYETICAQIPRHIVAKRKSSTRPARHSAQTRLQERQRERERDMNEYRVL